MINFQDQVVIVTGGGAGIGKAICRRFTEYGAQVVIAEIDEAAGRAAAEEIGPAARSLLCDISDEGSVEQMVAATIGAFRRIDVLVNNAAVFILHGIEAEVAQWRRILDVNVMGPALVAKHVVPHMRKAGGGAIVNLGSISSFIAQPHFVTYNATKAAVANMTRCMALDLAEDNIRVNAVCPGTVWTPIVERLTREEGLDRAAADRHPKWGAAHMIPRLADPVEIANAVLFLASDAASFITAECLMVDGGYTAK